MNIIALAGTLQSEPELRYTQDGVARLSVIITFSSEKEGEGDYQIRVIAFGNLADEVHQNYHHGDNIFVEGRLQIEKRSKPSAATREEMEKKETVAELIARKFHKTGGGVKQALPVSTQKTAPSAVSKATAPLTTQATQSASPRREKEAGTRTVKQTTPAPGNKPPTAVKPAASPVDEIDLPF